MNSPHKLAMQATELHAMATLSGEVMLHMNPAVAGSVCFLTVKEKVRVKLDTIVDDPEFQELFETVLSLGASKKNTYLSGFMEWCNHFVSGQFRRLRLQSCTQLNKINAGPHTKVA